jgi:HPt (histidine-containing phosphotransfer) domain-containing protein
MVVHDAVSALLPTGGLEPALDYAAGLDRMMGDHEMYGRVLARFRSDYRDGAARVRAACETGDAVLAQRLAHTLKGAAAMIEARGLRQAALDLEQALRDGRAPPAPMLGRLDAELERVMAQLDALPAAPAAREPAPARVLNEAELAQLCGLLDLGDSAAQDLIEEYGAGLRTLLGPARMAQLQAAVACFDFEGALHLLRPALAGHTDRLSG